ncbi:MAG: enoyl-CoA hydratase/isomerase family protein [Pseudomonadota bacterium]
MNSKTLIFSVTDKICTITLNRPDALNAFNQRLRLDLLKAIQTAQDDDTVRVIILKGEGKGFCAGADLGEGLDRDIGSELLNEYKPIMMALQESDKTCIAQCHGPVAGIGGGLAMACDMVFMAEKSYMYMAFAAISLIPDGGINWHLYNRLGPRKAFEVIVEGQRLTAQECLSYGICNAVLSENELESRVTEQARKIASGAPLAQSALKKVMRQMAGKSLSQAIDLEAEIQQPLTQSEDCRNAISAFFAKEKPVFEGK